MAGSRCRCDPGFVGDSCQTASPPANTGRVVDFKRTFDEDEAGVTSALTRMEGGAVVSGGGGCGQLRPYGYGRSAYFNACARRLLRTDELDLTRAG